MNNSIPFSWPSDQTTSTQTQQNLENQTLIISRNFHPAEMVLNEEVFGLK